LAEIGRDWPSSRSPLEARPGCRQRVTRANRLADWLSFHISHFGFNLEPFEASWAPRLSAGGAAGAADAADAADDAAAAGSPRAELPHDAFVRHILDKCLRLAYLERLQKGLPAPFVSHLPPQPAGRLRPLSPLASLRRRDSFAAAWGRRRRRLGRRRPVGGGGARLDAGQVRLAPQPAPVTGRAGGEIWGDMGRAGSGHGKSRLDTS